VFALGLVALECLTRRHPFVGADASPGAIVCSALSSEPVPLPTAAAAAGAWPAGGAQPAGAEGSPATPLSAAGSGSFGGSAWGSAGGCGGADTCGPLPTRECLEWLRAALKKDPAQRASAEQLLEHPWMAAELPAGCAEAAAAATPAVATPPAQAPPAAAWDGSSGSGGGGGGVDAWHAARRVEHHGAAGTAGTAGKQRAAAIAAAAAAYGRFRGADDGAGAGDSARRRSPRASDDASANELHAWALCAGAGSGGGGLYGGFSGGGPGRGRGGGLTAHGHGLGGISSLAARHGAAHSGHSGLWDAHLPRAAPAAAPHMPLPLDSWEY
jgi:hypothetical protein